MKKITFILAMLTSSIAYGGGWTSTAPVDHVEIIRGQGFQINASFGNPSSCSVPNSIFVSINHPQYDQLLSVSLAAFMGGKKLRIYSHQCVSYGWHGGTYNELTGAGSMYLHK
jgi:hypothetical protein